MKWLYAYTGYDLCYDLPASVKFAIFPRWKRYGAEDGPGYWEAWLWFSFSWEWLPFFVRVYADPHYPPGQWSAAWTGRDWRIIDWQWPHSLSLRIAGRRIL